MIMTTTNDHIKHAIANELEYAQRAFTRAVKALDEHRATGHMPSSNVYERMINAEITLSMWISVHAQLTAKANQDLEADVQRIINQLTAKLVTYRLGNSTSDMERYVSRRQFEDLQDMIATMQRWI